MKASTGHKSWLIFKAGGRICAFCRQTFDRNKELSVDHIVPRSMGGLHVRENMQLLCYPCAERKSQLEMDVMRDDRLDALMRRMYGKTLAEVSH